MQFSFPATAQNLRCFECTNCEEVDADRTPVRNCYTDPVTKPTQITNPATGKQSWKFKSCLCSENVFKSPTQFLWRHRLLAQHLLVQARRPCPFYQIFLLLRPRLFSLSTKTFHKSDATSSSLALQFVEKVNSTTTRQNQKPDYQRFLLVNGRESVDRGCTLLHPDDDETCRFENDGEDPDYCHVCDEDECNYTGGAMKIFLSISLIFAMLFLSTRLH